MKKYIALALILLGLSAQTMTAQTVGNVITNGLVEPDGVAVGWNGNIFVSDLSSGVISYNLDSGIVTNFYAELASPAGMVFVPSRDALFVGDTGLRQVIELAKDGSVLNVWGTKFQAGTNDSASLNGASFTSPAAFAADSAGNVYLTDVDSGCLRKISANDLVTTVASGFNKPCGVALDNNGNIYVADTMNHCIKMIAPNGTITTVAGTGLSQDAGFRNGPATTTARFNKPRGLIWVGGKVGLLICDSGNHVVRQLYNGVVTTYGDLGNSATPYNIARDPNNNYVVTDLTGNSLRSIIVTAVQPPVMQPIIGVVVDDTNIWGVLDTILIPVTNSVYFNDVTVAIIGEEGTSTFYIKGSTLDELPNPTPDNGASPPIYFSGNSTRPNSIVTPSEDGSDVTVKAIGTATGRKSSPIISAVFHFQVSTPAISGNNPGAFTVDTGATIGAAFWYTVDGKDPVPFARDAIQYVPGTILNIVNGTNDVDFRICGFKNGYKSSRVVEQLFLFANLKTSSIGVMQDFDAGIGSTIMVPVKLKMGTSSGLRSLQYRVEIKPDGNNDPILDQFRPLALDPANDFISIGTGVIDKSKPALFYWSSYSNNVAGKPVLGVSISFIGTNSNFEVDDFASVALLAVPIPPTANEGDSYTISVRYPSGTSDGQQLDVPLVSLQDRHIIVKNIPYLVGDSAVAQGYNAGEFGSLLNSGSTIANLANNDVNNAFYASMGVRTPFSFSDVFDAMDTFPEDSSFATGGDGQIRYLDWQIILNRSLRLDTNNWMRSWSAGGRRSVVLTNLTSALSTPAQRQSLVSSTKAWSRQAAISAAPVENAQPGTVIKVPVSLVSKSAPYVAGLQFRAVVEPVGSAPAIASTVQFVKSDSLPAPATIDGLQSALPANQTAVAWSLVQNGLPQAKMSKAILGYVTVTVPATAQAGQQYRVRFLNADGAPDLKTQYDFETLSSLIWVGTPAQKAQGVISDEWKEYFFGSLDNNWSAEDADPDGDGVTNAMEYQNGTSPVKLRLQKAQADTATDGGRTLTLKWFALQGCNYVVESSADLTHWTTLKSGITGSSELQEYTAALGANRNLFYRVRAQ